MNAPQGYPAGGVAGGRSALDELQRGAIANQLKPPPARLVQVRDSLSQSLKGLDELNARLLQLNVRLTGHEPTAQTERAPGAYGRGSLEGDRPEPPTLDVLDMLAGRASELVSEIAYQVNRLERL